MNYTEEDILTFIQAHKWYKDGPAAYAGLSLDVCLVAIRGKERKLFKKDLFRIPKGGSPGYEEGLSYFLHAVPLEDVPLYLEDFPDFSMWRLTIAK